MALFCFSVVTVIIFSIVALICFNGVLFNDFVLNVVAVFYFNVAVMIGFTHVSALYMLFLY